MAMADITPVSIGKPRHRAKKYHGMRAQIADFIHIPERAQRNTNLSTAQ